MFFLYLVAFSGIFYLFERYRRLSEKRLFFNSSLFKSVAISLAIFAVSLAVVNVFGPPRRVPALRIGADSLTSEEKDTTVAHLAGNSAAFHYHLLHKLYTFDRYERQRAAVGRQYLRMTAQVDSDVNDIGNFGLGVMAMIEDNYALAKGYFIKIHNSQLPFVHYCLGDIGLEEGAFEIAAAEYRSEMKVAGGNFRESVMRLLDLYEEDRNYLALGELISDESVGKLFPEHLARKTLLYNGEMSEYLLWLLRTIQRQVHAPGLLAAVAISLVWLTYLISLDIFNRSRMRAIAGMFVTGFISVLAVISLNDAFELFTTWSRDGDMLNDFYYCFVMIGIPEELTKIFPLVVLLVFAGRLKDPLDYILMASASALGFAFVENIVYFQDLTDGIIHGRAYVAAIGHMIDSSFVAYGFVLNAFGRARHVKPGIVLLMSFFAGSLSHAIYDFLLYHELTYAFFVYFILVIQVWIVLINNCLNNSANFSYSAVRRLGRLAIFLPVALVSLFALEYVITGFQHDREFANRELAMNFSGALFLIIVFSSNLSTFDLVRGYWRDVYFKARTRSKYADSKVARFLFNWYLSNALRAHNYVGMRVSVLRRQNGVYHEIVRGTICDRRVIFHGGVRDPHWFIIKPGRSIIYGCESGVVCIRLVEYSDSLSEQRDVRALLRVGFAGAPDQAVLMPGDFVLRAGHADEEATAA